MRKASTTKKAVKATVSAAAAAEAQTLAERAVDYAAEIDYKKVAKQALKVAIPLVVLKMLHNKYKKSAKKATKWEKVALPLFAEIKAKLKDM